MTNTFVFSWDMHGIESIISISEYEYWDQQNLLEMIGGKQPTPNPLNKILRNLILRATANHQRHYEIYSVACDDSLDKEFWHQQWTDYPQETADLVRGRGHKIYSNRINKEKVKIT